MNHAALQSAVSPDTLSVLRAIIQRNGDDNTLKALAGVLAECGKPKTAQAVLVARTEALIEVPNPRNLPPLPLQWWVFDVCIVRSHNDRVEESGVVYVRGSSMNRARHAAVEHARATWAMSDPDEPQRIDVRLLGTAEDTSPIFNRPETVFTLGCRMD